MAQKLETFQISYILFALVLNALPCIYLTINYLLPLNDITKAPFT